MLITIRNKTILRLAWRRRHVPKYVTADVWLWVAWLTGINFPMLLHKTRVFWNCTKPKSWQLKGYAVKGGIAVKDQDKKDKRLEEYGKMMTRVRDLGKDHALVVSAKEYDDFQRSLTPSNRWMDRDLALAGFSNVLCENTPIVKKPAGMKLEVGAYKIEYLTKCMRDEIRASL